MDLTIITTALDWIVKILVGLRTALTNLHVPYSIVALIISSVGTFYLLKQWVVSSMFYKLSTILNMLLLILVFYLLLTRVA